MISTVTIIHGRGFSIVVPSFEHPAGTAVANRESLDTAGDVRPVMAFKGKKAAQGRADYENLFASTHALDVRHEVREYEYEGRTYYVVVSVRQSATLRPATEEETEAWLAGHLAVEGAVETEHGLLVPQSLAEKTTCVCGEDEVHTCAARYGQVI